MELPSPLPPSEVSARIRALAVFLLVGCGALAFSGIKTASFLAVIGMTLVAEHAGRRSNSVGQVLVWATVLATLVAVLLTLLEASTAEGPVSRPALFFTLWVGMAAGAVHGRIAQNEVSRLAALQKVAVAKLGRSNQVLEDAIQAREASLHQISTMVDSMADGVALLDPDSVPSLANPAFLDMIGVQAGSNWHLEATPPALRDAVAVVRNDQDGSRCEWERSSRVYEAITAPVAWPRERYGVVILVRDMTHRRDIAKIREDLVSVVSHEMRTPLTSVLGFTRLIEMQMERHLLPQLPVEQPAVRRSVEQVRQNIDIIVNEAERLNRLISDMLDLSKVNSEHVPWEMRRVRANDLVDRAFEVCSGLFTGDRPVSFHRADERVSVELFVEPDRIHQLLVNLIGNASKFTVEGSVELGVSATEDEVCFFVSDTGIGIHPAELGGIFEPFQQAGDALTDRPVGTGLGLAICRQIVERHGGEIRVESALGSGSRFECVLPRSASATSHEAHVASASTLPTGSQG